MADNAHSFESRGQAPYLGIGSGIVIRAHEPPANCEREDCLVTDHGTFGLSSCVSQFNKRGQRIPAEITMHHPRSCKTCGKKWDALKETANG